MARNRPFASRITPTTPKSVISETARQRPVRVIPADDRAEREAGHLTWSGSGFSSNMTRPDTESVEGFGNAAGFGDAPAPESDAGYSSDGGAFGGFADSSSPEESR